MRWATIEPFSRLAAWLGQLLHIMLAELTAQLCSESPARQAAAEECMAAHDPPPLEMVERVLLSPDLVPSILLLAENGAVAAVCTHWLAVWEATKLKQVPLDFPDDVLTEWATMSELRKRWHDDLGMAATPDGRLLVSAGFKLYTLDRSMRVLQMRNLGVFPGRILAASDVSVIVDTMDLRETCFRSLARSSHDDTEEAKFKLEDYNVWNPVLVPGGLVFCTAMDDRFRSMWPYDAERLPAEILALDAQTLQLRYRFGQGLLDDPRGMVVVGDELYVCDLGNDRLQVFTLTGEHHRSVTGKCRRPERLCFAKDRLYLVEEKSWGNLTQGHRLLVLSLQGDILQVFKHPTDATMVFTDRSAASTTRCW